MKTNLLSFRVVVQVPEEWPAAVSHGDPPDRVTHGSLGLPNSVHSILDNGLNGIEAALKAINPEIDLVVEK